MQGDPVSGAYVVCVGLSLAQVSQVARLLRDNAVVLATPDARGARTLFEDEYAGHHPPDGDHGGAGLRVGEVEVDLATREVRIAGAPVHMSVREFDLLAALASDTQRVWSFAELTERVWHTGYLGDPDPVISTVKRLRKRLGSVSRMEVSSVRGIGYRLVPR